MIEENELLNSTEETITPLCEIHIHQDKMKVSLWLRKNKANQTVSLNDIKTELAKQGVIFGIVSDKVLEELIEDCPVENIMIAEGIYPIDGQDSKFVSLLPETFKGTPVVNDEDGIVDYRELGGVLVVKKNDPLLNVIPATQGQAGKNVFGEIVAQQKGIDKRLLGNSNNTYVDPNNPLQLLAAITGQPILTEEGAYVSPVLELENIDLSTGNVRFNGSIIVKNNIESGIQVYASKDIMVGGHVIDSRVECLGDVSIKEGVFGNSEIITNGNVEIQQGVQGNSISDDSTLVARIVSSGTVSVKFAENFVIEAEKNIVVEKYVMNCTLMADKISVGTKSLLGSIVGGMTWATQLIKAPVLGNESGIITKLRTGVNPQIQSAIEELLSLLAINENKQKNVLNTLEHFKNFKKTPEIQNRIEQLNFISYELKSEADAYQQEIEMLKAEIKYSEKPQIVASKRINLGVAIQIKQSFWKRREELLGKTIFTLDEFGQVAVLKNGSNLFK